ncbi:NAD(P)-dependent oxidoreductase [Georgenia sp. Marseille-Q6866]
MTTEPAFSQNVTVLGLGAMGTAIASAFLDAGHHTTVWNRTSAKADGLVQKGGLKAASLADAVGASPLIVVCVSDYAAVEGLLDSVEDFDQRTLVNVTSGGAAAARELEAWVQQRNGRYLDGAILAMTSEIGPDQSGMVLVSGDASSWTENEKTLAALGGGLKYLGSNVALAGLHDLAGLAVTWSVLNAFMHAAALFESVGESPKSMVPLIEDTLKSAASWLPGYADQIESGDIAPDGDIAGTLQAMENLLEESVAAGINTDLPKFLRGLAAQAVDAGDGGKGYPALIHQLRKPSVAAAH